MFLSNTNLKRIVLVNTYHYHGGGDSSYTFNLSNLLMNKGHRIDFFAMQGKRNLPDRNSDLFVNYIDFRELNRHKSVEAAMQVLCRAIYSRQARRNFAKLIERVRPDVVHLQNIHAHITPSIIFECRSRSIPVVWTLHDYKLVCPNSHYLIDSTARICEACGNGSYYQAIVRKCKKGSRLASSFAAVEAYGHRLMRVRERVDSFITPSRFLRDKLLAHNGFEPQRVIHVPLFIDQALFSSKQQDDGYLLFMAKLESMKGIHVLNDACRRVPSVNVVLAGRSEKGLAGQVDRSLPHNAAYLGMKHGTELRELRAKARAIVLPSIWYENQPFTILEAFAVGKPVIASDLGGMTELVKHGERGLLVPAGDAQSLAEAMQWMSDHPAEARAMGERARAYALAEHGADKHYQRLMAVYSRVLNGKSRAQG